MLGCAGSMDSRGGRWLSRAALLSAVGLAGLALSGCVGVTDSTRHTVTLEDSVAWLGAGPLAVTTRNGDVTIDRVGSAGGAEGGEVSIRAMLKSFDEGRVREATVVVERLDGNALSVGVDWPGGRQRNEGADFVIRIPDAFGLDIETSNGDVTAHEFSGELEINTSNGDIEVRRHVGAISIATSNGEVEVDGATGLLDVKTSNAAIAARLAPGNAGPVVLRSSNDPISLTVGPAFRGVVEASTSNDTIRVFDLPAHSTMTSSTSRRRATIRFGDADEPVSTVSTSNDGVTIRYSDGLDASDGHRR